MRERSRGGKYLCNELLLYVVKTYKISEELWRAVERPESCHYYTSEESFRAVLQVKNTSFIFTHSMSAHHQLLVSELSAAVSPPQRGIISLNIERNTVLLLVPQTSQNVTVILSAHAY